ncbi:recombinase family protein [Metabacillus sp. cB07]|uniref:recombinase family protein n=1 Tax=Metabacillus sp. cB07 TaxID=2806989 RepID=UPI00193AA742|nr:recombinase family protein [Metabacillus sp. cB07]
MTNNNTREDFYAVYRRVSSDRQVENGESLETQYALAENFVMKQDKQIHLLDYCEQGISASKIHYLKRPALNRMLEDARKGLFSTLLVFKRDRLDRSNDFHIIKYLLIKAKVKIVYLDPNELNIQDDIYGNLLESVITSIAAIEPKLTSIRVKSYFEEKSKKGLWKTGKPPYGLYYDKETSSLISIPNESEVIKKIFHYYVYEKLGYRSIAIKLNNENIPFRNNKGIEKQWSTSNIKSIISNPIYKGYIRLNKDDGSNGLIQSTEMDTPIIPPTIFDMAEQIKLNRRNYTVTPREIKTNFLLSKILYCSCGNKMIGVDNSYSYISKRTGEKSYRKYIYYSCGLYAQGKHKGICNVKRINADILHKITIDKCCKLFEPSNYDRTLDKLEIKQTEAICETKIRIKEISRRVSEMNRKIEVIFENLEASTQIEIVKKYEKRLELRTNELKNLQTELSHQKRYYNDLKEKVWTLEEVSEKLKNWGYKIYEVKPEVQRRMLLDVISKVQLNEQGELFIELKLSLDNFEARNKEEGAHNNSYVHLFPYFIFERVFFTFNGIMLSRFHFIHRILSF